MKKTRLLLLICSLLITLPSVAQTGDQYGDAIVVPHQQAWVSQYTNDGMTIQSPVSACQSFAHGNNNKWFRFTAVTNYVKIKATGDNSANNSRLVLWQLSGSTWSELACVTGVTSLTVVFNSLVPGNLYYFSMETRYTHIPYQLSVTNGDFPGNYYTSAIEVPHAEYWENVFTNMDMSLQQPVSTCSGFTMNNSNKWFKFMTTTNSATVQIAEGNSSNNIRIVLWRSTASGLVEVGCAVGTVTAQVQLNSLTANATYYLSVETRYEHIPYKLIVTGGAFTGYWSVTGQVLHPTEISRPVGIGTTVVPDGYMLSIDGKIITEGVKVLLSEKWPDYVFEAGYPLWSLPEVKKYIAENKHLPDVPSATEVEAEGMDVGQINAQLLKKIEELTLYKIRQHEEIELLKGKVAELEKGGSEKD